MPNVLNTLYPPSVATYMPAFNYDEAVTVYFSISSFNEAKEIEYVHVSVVDQRTNENVLSSTVENTKMSIPVAIYEMWKSNSNKNLESDCLLYNPVTGLYSIKIDPSMIKTERAGCFNINQFYKVQIRFEKFKTDGTTKYESTFGNNGRTKVAWVNGAVIKEGKDLGTSYSRLLNNYILENLEYFSEWSQICLIKPTLIPKIVLTDFYDGESEYTTRDNPLIEDMPNFDATNIIISGRLRFFKTTGDNRDLRETETLDNYTISIVDSVGNVIYKGKKTYTANKIADNSINEINTMITLDGIENLSVEKIYFVYIEAYTSNSLLVKNTYFRFKLTEYTDKPEMDILFDEDVENGILALNLSMKQNDENESGALIIRRSCDISNFKEWELFRIIKITGDLWDKNSVKDWLQLKIVDNTIGSLNWYRYSFQFRNSKGKLSAGVHTESLNGFDRTQFCEFDDAIFVRKDRQLAVKYDFSIGSYKPIVNRAKIDTLGGKYPKFAENAILGYKQFSISGKISSQADDNELFLDRLESFGEYAYEDYYKLNHESHASGHDEYGNLIIKDNIDSYDDCHFRGNWLEYKDWLLERKFREEAIKWLNDGEPKLLKTLTEGNICVMLTDINLTPEKALGRRLYNFSATAYEVGDGYSLVDLDRLGIFEVVDETAMSFDDFIKKAEEGSSYPSYDDSYRTVHRLFQLSDFSISKEKWYNAVKDETAGRVETDLSEYIISYINLISNTDINNPIYSIPNVNDYPGTHIWMTNVKINFKNLPHLYKVIDSANGIPEHFEEIILSNETEENIKEMSKNKDVYIGYVIRVYFTNEPNNSKEIFINKNGYYQFPSDLSILKIEFPGMANSNDNANSNQDMIDFDCFLHYHLLMNQDRIFTAAKTVKEVIGQEIGTFNPNENIKSNIYKKYYYVNTEMNDGITYKEYLQYLDEWKGCTIEAEPHSIIKIKYYDKNNKTPFEEYFQYEIGETGYLNLSNDYPIYDIMYCGKRMVRIYKEPEFVYEGVHNGNKRYLRENEYYHESNLISKTIDDIKEPKQQHVYYIEKTPFTSHYVIYWNEKFYPFILSLDQEIENDGIFLEWKDAENTDIPNGYVVEVNGKKCIKYDNLWLELEDYFKSLGVDVDNDYGIALIPSDINIDYRGTVIRKYY